MFGHVADDNRIAQIGLVTAVLQHRLAVRNARKAARWRHLFAVRKFLKQPRQNRLKHVEHILLRDEAHLEIELIELTG